MYVARLVCSDADCAEEITLENASPAELETLVCECGCALAVIGWAEPLADAA